MTRRVEFLWAANNKGWNEIGVNVYWYWHCWLIGIIGIYEIWDFLFSVLFRSWGPSHQNKTLSNTTVLINSSPFSCFSFYNFFQQSTAKRSIMLFVAFQTIPITMPMRRWWKGGGRWWYCQWVAPVLAEASVPTNISPQAADPLGQDLCMSSKEEYGQDKLQIKYLIQAT